MVLKLVRTTTTDGQELQGLISEADKMNDRIVIHIHGTWGNFYGNPFIDQFITEYPKNGYSFLSGNTRGHDEGSISEKFEDCKVDINQWISFAESQGYKHFILQGHSLGALKTVYYDNDVNNPLVRKLILLSPFDSVAFYCSRNPQKREILLSELSGLVLKSPNEIAPKDIWGMWMISNITLYNMLREETVSDIFPFRKGDLQGSALSRIHKNIFAAIGGNDFAAFPDPSSEYLQLSKMKRVKSVLIPNAPHNFAGYEKSLMEHILEWLRE